MGKQGRPGELALACGVGLLFVGPVVLAVTYTLLLAWVDDREKAVETSDAG